MEKSNNKKKVTWEMEIAWQYARARNNDCLHWSIKGKKSRSAFITLCDQYYRYLENYGELPPCNTDQDSE